MLMTASIDGVKTNYGYVYWRRDSISKLPEYICTGNTYDSQDGEYRFRFTTYASFVAAFEKYADVLHPFEVAVISMIEKGELSVDATIFPEIASSDILDNDFVSRLPFMSLAAALAIDINAVSVGELMDHSTEGYVAMINDVIKRYPDLVDDSLKIRSITPLVLMFHKGIPGDGISAGQKIIPLYTREVIQGLDPTYSSWRELLITQSVSELIINYVCPSVAIFGQWAYIEGSNRSLFENDAMMLRYKRGDAAARATGSLRDARRDLADGVMTNSKRAQELRAMVYEDIEYAQSYALISDVALLYTMEHVGVSMGSLGNVLRRADSMRLLPSVLSCLTGDFGIRMLFEFMYGAHCLHTKIGIVHTDLHINNLTYYRWGYITSRKNIDGKITDVNVYPDATPMVMYVTGPRGEADSYVFPASGASGCIIDYSRAVLGPMFRPRLEKGRGAQHASNIYRDQVNRILRAFIRYAPSIVKDKECQDALRSAIVNNLDAVMPVLAIVDYIAIGQNVGTMLRDEQALVDPRGVRPIAISRDMILMCDRIEAAARELLIVRLQDLIESAGDRVLLPAPADFPGPALFAKLFGKWSFARWVHDDPTRMKTTRLVDAYNYNNEMKYDGTSYARFPPWAQLSEIERNLGEFTMDQLFDRGVEPFLSSLNPDPYIGMITDRIRAHEEALDGPPVKPGSSIRDF